MKNPTKKRRIPRVPALQTALPLFMRRRFLSLQTFKRISSAPGGIGLTDSTAAQQDHRDDADVKLCCSGMYMPAYAEVFARKNVHDGFMNTNTNIYAGWSTSKQSVGSESVRSSSEGGTYSVKRSSNLSVPSSCHLPMAVRACGTNCHDCELRSESYNRKIRVVAGTHNTQKRRTVKGS
eukprot:1178836-Prorocentrum_minimum.AAC.5